VKLVSLSEVASVRSGYAFKSKDWVDSGIPVVKIANIKDGFLTLDGCSFVNEAVARQATSFGLEPGDILISMTGYIGEVARVRDEGRMLLNQRVGRFLVTDRSRLDGDYLFHCLRDPSLKARFAAHAHGAAQPNISAATIEQQAIPLPSLAVQRRIAGILSAYDDLIENCQRRIQILEQMSRALYREWFVKFRYPGHESVPLVPSPLGEIPQGWEVKKLGDVLELNYGKALKQEDRRGGDVPVFGSSGIVGQHDTALVKGPGIIVGRKGNVGSVFWCADDFYVIDTAYFVNSSLPLRFLFYVLPTLNFINSDAAVPGLSRNQAYTLEILVPPTALLEKFCALADIFEHQASTIQRQIRNLRRTRDLLLPRLISGQIDLGAA